MPVTSQSSTVSFRDQVIGELLSVTVSPATADIKDWPGWGSYSFENGGYPVFKPWLWCHSVMPGGCQISFLGSGGLSDALVGRRGGLVISLADGGHGFSAEAILETYEIQASVGELLRGSASFVFTGRPYP